jgi:hypothetical protein
MVAYGLIEHIVFIYVLVIIIVFADLILVSFGIWRWSLRGGVDVSGR